jgi:hypothetical protein
VSEWSEYHLNVVRSPGLWGCRNLIVSRKHPRYGESESGFITAEGGVARCRVIAGLNTYGYASWEGLLDAGWRPD